MSGQERNSAPSSCTTSSVIKGFAGSRAVPTTGYAGLVASSCSVMWLSLRGRRPTAAQSDGPHSRRLHARYMRRQ